MRLRLPIYALSLVAVAGVAGGAYAFGFYEAKGKMDNFCGWAISGTGAGDHVPLFEAHSKALSALRTGRSQDAEVILKSMLKTDVALISECVGNAECARLMVNKPPSAEVLRNALSQ